MLLMYLEWLFLPGALFPAADEGLFVGGDVIVVDVLDEFVLSVELEPAFAPVAIRLRELGLALALTITLFAWEGGNKGEKTKD